MTGPTSSHIAPARRIAALSLAALVIVGAGTMPARLAFAKGAPDTFADLAANVSDAVVNISATQTAPEGKRTAQGSPSGPQLRPGSPLNDLFEEFRRRGQRRGGNDGDDEESPRSRRGANSLGSGFIIDAAGIVITNNHVIADSNEVSVILTDGTKLKAEVVGKDAKVDVAVLRVKPEKPLKAVKFADSDRARVGDWVMAVGNPFGLGGSVTAGIVSARNRNIDSGASYVDYIQTDASINKGNSGGPLFNMDGDVIGITTAILSPSGGSVGIGFATPANTVLPVIDQLKQFGETRRGWLGVRIQQIDDAIADSLDLGKTRGALVAGVDERGPAKTAGLKARDVITRFDGKEVRSSKDLPKLVGQEPVGKTVDVVVIRGGKEITAKVTLGRLEDGEKLASLGGSDEPKPDPAPVQAALGMTFGQLTDETRQKFNIKESVKSGVVVTNVDTGTSAADNRLKKGDVIIEINSEAVEAPGDVARRVKALKDAGKKSALLLVATLGGEARFVPVAID